MTRKEEETQNQGMRRCSTLALWVSHGAFSHRSRLREARLSFCRASSPSQSLRFLFCRTRLGSSRIDHHGVCIEPLHTCLLTRLQLDRLVGAMMLIIASTVFLYYTIWTLAMVSTYIWGSFFSGLVPYYSSTILRSCSSKCFHQASWPLQILQHLSKLFCI